MSEAPEIEITHREDGSILTKDLTPIQKKPSPYKNAYKSVKDWVGSSDPNTYLPQNYPLEFDHLKNKVLSLRKSEKCQEKQNFFLTKDDGSSLSKLEASLKDYTEKILEKQKLFDQLVVMINDTRKGMRHNILLPMDLIKEETDTQKVLIGQGGEVGEGSIFIVVAVGEDESRFAGKGVRLSGLKFWCDDNGLTGICGKFFF